MKNNLTNNFMKLLKFFIYISNFFIKRQLNCKVKNWFFSNIHNLYLVKKQNYILELKTKQKIYNDFDISLLK